ncbi:calcium-binding protein [Actinomadura spongiicola]|uniref:Calcium-binding protein n=1 Tax=Actinomadura spongiicola TaxID=2303421 RepID=A0A372GPB0_9ACTN|nr:calcium-binding protein [Actinomadura spongiicola]RFS87204.1 calcium-binding protein [Actinomadura spongiicola]
MRIRPIIGTLTLLGAALGPVAAAGPAHADSATCRDQKSGLNLTVTKPGTPDADALLLIQTDVSSGLDGDDWFFHDAVEDSPFSSDVVICGDAGSDSIGFINSPARGTLSVLGGDDGDSIRGGGNGDILNGNKGTDTIWGLDGDDHILGEGGVDTLHGGLGKDDIRGGDDNDNLFGNEGDDTINGDNGWDLIDGGPGHDTCYGEVTVNCEFPPSAARPEKS